MVKNVTVLKLRPGVDPDETWKYWRETHVSWVKNKALPEMKKYKISRVIDTIGENDIYGFAEGWFDDLESAQRAMGRITSAEPDELLSKRVIPIRTIVQEEEIEL